MRIDSAERYFIRLVMAAVLLFYLYGVVRNALVVYQEPSRSVEAYWFGMTLGLAASVIALAWTWHDINVALLVFNWCNLIAITVMALYDAQYTSEPWSGLIYAPSILGVSLMTLFVCGRQAIMYGVAVTIASVIEGVAYCENVHAVFSISLTWFFWALMWIVSRRDGRLQYQVAKSQHEITELQNENRKVKGACVILRTVLESEAECDS